MRKFLFLFGALGFAGAAAQAQTTSTAVPAAAPASVPLPAAQRMAALDLLTAMQTEQQLAGQMDLMLRSHEAAQAQLLAQSPKLQTPERKAQQADMQANMREFYQKSVGWDAVKENMVQAYGSTFSADELHRLAAFYRSDTGQMLLRKQPEAFRLVAAAAQRRTLALMPEMQRLMQAQHKWSDIQKATPKMPGQQLYLQ
ncbi:DUF2059 domain-containing protein [Hymenobacter sp. PAMC 26628]|uniref:DUF2059 domain-containing protein n=1 Tax=Hymenobacter sp. PAMC 26628 TaxID=1484118 RepID=UPI00077051CB|nr:DUF2059 domain-containing protein [Hymenobacter sp. PAMC 26628]AMJ66601.1 hypothetical protein AXW84_15080 [Hymenobacter sp. PAMC 26628]